MFSCLPAPSRYPRPMVLALVQFRPALLDLFQLTSLLIRTVAQAHHAETRSPSSVLGFGSPVACFVQLAGQAFLIRQSYLAYRDSEVLVGDLRLGPLRN